MKRKSIIPTQYPAFREEINTFNLDIIKDTFNINVIPNEIDIDKPAVYNLYFYNMHLIVDMYDFSTNDYSKYTQLFFRGAELLKSLYTVDSDGNYITVVIDKSISPDSTGIVREDFILRANIVKLIA